MYSVQSLVCTQGLYQSMEAPRPFNSTDLKLTITEEDFLGNRLKDSPLKCCMENLDILGKGGEDG